MTMRVMFLIKILPGDIAQGLSLLKSENDVRVFFMVDLAKMVMEKRQAEKRQAKRRQAKRCQAKRRQTIENQAKICRENEPVLLRDILPKVMFDILQQQRCRANADYTEIRRICVFSALRCSADPFSPGRRPARRSKIRICVFGSIFTM